MNKTEYMKILSHRLRHLPKEDYYKALDYFEEYFAEAGPENEQQAIEDLGSPEAAAKEVLMNLAQENASRPPKNMKKGLSAVWIGILGICAAPIALPLVLALVAIVTAMVICLFTILLAVVITAISVIACGFISFIGGSILLLHSFSDGLCNIGIGIFALGSGLLFTYGAILLFKFCIKKVPVFLGKIIKGGRKNETQQ